MKNKLYILLGVIAILTIVFATGFTSRPVLNPPGGGGQPGGGDNICKGGKDHPCPKPTAVVPVDPCPPQNKNVGSCESDYHRLHIPHPSGGLNWLQGIWAQLTSQTWWPKF